MMGSGRPMGYRDIVADITRRIVTGRWPPGTRLPTKLDLCREFDTSVGTMQRALHVLAVEGLTYSRGRAGTFVCERPAHLSRVAVVFLSPIESSIWHRGLELEFRRLTSKGPFQFEAYAPGQAGGRALHGTPDGFLSDLAAQRLAGVIFIGPPAEEQSAAVASCPRLGRVVIGGASQAPNMPSMVHEPEWPRVLDFLARGGRRRLGLITTYFLSRTAQMIADEAERRGIETRRCWTHCLSPDMAWMASPIVELMLSLPRGERPDALYIADDHLVREATRGVHLSNLQAGAELDVVAHCNFPYAQPTDCAVTFIGYDLRAVCRTAMEIVALQLENGSPAPLTLIKPVFQSEIEDPGPSAPHRDAVVGPTQGR